MNWATNYRKSLNKRPIDVRRVGWRKYYKTKRYNCFNSVNLSNRIPATTFCYLFTLFQQLFNDCVHWREVALIANVHMRLQHISSRWNTTKQNTHKKKL